MIKFVCSSCGERLSVPDQHAGRKGVCPNCQAINRIPLKGAVAAGQKPALAERPTEPVPLVSHSLVASDESQLIEPPSRHNSIPLPAPVEWQTPAEQEFPRREMVYSGERREIAPRDWAADSADISTADSSTTSATPENIRSNADDVGQSFSPSYEEVPESLSASAEVSRSRGVPRPVKIALLIIAALVIVGMLYFALLFALHALVPEG